MLGSELTIVRFATYWTGVTLNSPRLSVIATMAVRVTATQYAG